MTHRRLAGRTVPSQLLCLPLLSHFTLLLLLFRRFPLARCLSTNALPQGVAHVACSISLVRRLCSEQQEGLELKGVVTP